VVELRVVQTVEQVDGARAGRRHAHTHRPGELRVSDGRERRHLLVPGLDELRPVLGLPERAHEAVDPVPGIGEDLLDTPLPQPAQDVVTY
jgi:hypothetical protein